jgi:hypothetical protein
MERRKEEREMEGRKEEKESFRQKPKKPGNNEGNETAANYMLYLRTWLK